MIRDITWDLAARMPAALKGHAQGAIGNGIVLCCGTQFEAESPGDVRRGTATALGRRGWILNTRAPRYDLLPDAPTGVKWAGGAAVADDFYVLTGMVPDSGASPRMFRLSLSSAAPGWHEMPPLNTGRFIPGIAVAGTTIHVVGGEAAVGPTGSSDAAQTTSTPRKCSTRRARRRGGSAGPPSPARPAKQWASRRLAARSTSLAVFT